MAGEAGGETPDAQTPDSGASSTPEATNDQAGNQPQGGATPSASGTDNGEANGLKSALDKERRDRQAKEKALKAAEDRIKAFEEAQLSDQEKQAKALAEAQERVSTLSERVRQAFLTAEVTREAVAMGVVDPEAALHLLPLAGTVEYDDDDRPTNAKQLLTDLVAQRPFLVRAEAPKEETPAPKQSGAATNGPSERTMGKLTAAQIAGMSQEEIASRWEEVVEALAAK